MFGKMKGMVEQMQMMQRLMKDENFRAFMSHPKVQELFKDPEFQEIVKSKDQARVMSHPKMVALVRDPEVGEMMKKLDPSILFPK